MIQDIDKPYRVIIAGGRDFNDYKLLETKCNHLFSKRESSDLEIVCGDCRGTDTLGETYAGLNGIVVKHFPADWDKYGKSAGYRRNEEMAAYSNALIAFWDGKSKGTKHMIDLAYRYNLEVRIIKY